MNAGTRAGARAGAAARRGAALLALAMLAGCGASDGAGGPSAAGGEARAARTPARLPAGQRAFDVAVSGRGRPIIFIPGLASSGETWASAVQHLRGSHACHVLTLAGFAGVAPVRGPLLARVRDELARYIEDQGLDRPVIVGHSLGGDVALDLAARHPGRVGALVIVDSLPFLAGAMLQVDSLEAARPMVERLRAQMEGQTPEQYRAMAASGMWTRSMVTSPDDLKRVIAWGVASDQATVTRAMVELLGTDLRPDLAKVEAPALVLGTWIGERAAQTAAGVADPRQATLRTFQEQYAPLPHMKLVMSDRARHFIMLDDPAWFLAQVDAFLADPAAATRDRGEVAPGAVAAPAPALAPAPAPAAGRSR
ncbi:MAG TPA: alpha/beta hydrolase [Kofleriaceae bacterium]|nr:alpha/beta hydrolase [Kofleriaceae bacterium]